MAFPLPESNDGAPIHESGKSYSSIGPKWPPVRASHERIKGIFTPGVLNNLDEFETDFFSAFNEYRESPLFGERSNQGYSRISLRALVSLDLLKNLPHQYRESLEAVILLSGTQPYFENHALVYFGANHETRLSDSHRLEQNWQNLQRALEKQPKHPDEIIRRPQEQGYELSVIEDTSKPDESLVKELHQLIKRFNYSEADTRNMLADPTFTLAVARRDGQIVAAGLAETNEVEIGDATLVMVELTEASTDRNHLGKGLYSGISTAMLKYLSEKSKQHGFNGKEIDVVFGESNGSAPGVLITAVYQGRTFSTQICNEAGYDGKGVLPLHVPILDPDEEYASEEIRRNNNLFPSFINRKTLYELYS